MIRTVAYLSVLAALFALCAAGCGPAKGSADKAAADKPAADKAAADKAKADKAAADKAAKKASAKSAPKAQRGKPPVEGTVVKGIDFNRYWPRAEVVKLSDEERATLLELALVGIRGSNWDHARDVLVSLGEHAIPALVAQVEAPEATHAGAAPVPVVLGSGVKTLGELSHDVLLEIVQYHSEYKGQLPVRSKDAWEAWWKQNAAGFKMK
jgi:hypothetical protein